VLGPDGSPAPDTWVTATPKQELMFGSHGPMPGMGLRDGDGDGDGDGEETTVQMGAMVVVADEDGGDDIGGGFGGGLSMRGTPPVLTDDAGRFEIRGLRRGEYDLMAEGLRGTARGFASGVSTGDDATVKLVALTRIDGAVTQDGKPVTLFRVEVQGPSMRFKSVRSDDGTFVIHRVDPGSYTVRVTSAEGAGEAKIDVVAGTAAEVAIDLASMVMVTGQVVDKDGAPVAGAMVLLGSGSIGGGDMEITMTSDEEPSVTDDDGRFRLRAAIGNHLLIVLGADHQPLLMKPIDVTGDLDLGVLKQSGMKLGQR
jgi:hypothetical protein